MCRHPISLQTKQLGLTLVEVLIVIAIGGLLLVSLSGVVSSSLQSRDISTSTNDLSQQANFAMQRMVKAVANSQKLLLPLKYSTERNVLAVTLSPIVDIDNDGKFDADNDGDGRFDEDLGKDITNDKAPGIIDIDDDDDGRIDEDHDHDDDEDGDKNEDPVNGIDDDGDGRIDEDPHDDLNGDDCPGICGVDDDGDGSTDEGSKKDDDEDALKDEDWYDPVVFYLNGSDLIGRIPVPWDQNGDSKTTGKDYIETVLAANVTKLSIERLPLAGGRSQLVKILLQLTNDTDESITLATKVRVAGNL